MAPEQVIAEGVDQRSDLYAMGIVLWEFLTLKRYIKRAPVPIMLRAQVNPVYLPPSQSRGDIPAALEAVCAKALDVDPKRRFQTASEFIDAIDEAVPPREEEEPLATIVGAMLWGELGQSKTEVTKLLSVVPSPEPTPKVTVEVFAEATPLALATPLLNMQVEAPSNGVPVKAVILLMGLTLLIGLGIGALLLNDPAPPLRASPLPPPSPQVEVAAPKPAAAPIVTPSPPPIEEEPPVKAAPLKRLARVEDTAPAPRPQKIDPPTDRERLLALMKRARALRARVAGSDKEPAVTGLLAKAAQEASASEVNAAVLAEMERALRALEAQ
jgi:eukaryotic-like serine/threonine-protein kinase